MNKFSLTAKTVFLFFILGLTCVHMTKVIIQYKNSNMKIVLVPNDIMILPNFYLAYSAHPDRLLDKDYNYLVLNLERKHKNHSVSDMVQI